MSTTSPTEPRAEFWFSFCEQHGLGSDPVPLFAATHGRVDTVEYGKSGKLFLRRSPEMEDLLRSQAQLLIDDHNSGSRVYQGLLYCMFEMINDRAHPLYIGKTEKFGKGNENLSANLDMTDGKFARWGYGYAYHMGDLSAVVLGHPGATRERKYEKWTDSLFESPLSERRLTRPVYFWAKAWKARDVGPWVQFGKTSLTFAEYLLIGVASSVFRNLLNDEGVNR